MPRRFQKTIIYLMIFVLVVGTFLAGFASFI
nr:stressosome-associated protein Prli42 [Geomicrobium halophilum]